ncbi:50S ribosomal protein L21 [Chitinispirillales bacterium ANBcel5]|uniref:50S ribosomal protein L21 n=1 Tax=Cellulosispirillum alkaliphilum TaxID=3039283 RepID=UPI002A57666A|nr:50S ribosomal protein L21 [Chitinispirillales bacterium ANBcel5]
MYSIIEQGGAQFKVSSGMKIRVPFFDAEAGTEFTIDRVLLAANGDDVKIGNPVVEGASVKAKVLEQEKGDKVLVVKKKRRKDYKRVNGHRQLYTKVEIISIDV